MEEYRLSYCQSTGAGDGAVDSGVVLVGPDDGFQDFRGGPCCVGIQIHHGAADVVRGDGDGGGVGRVAEGEDAA